MIQHNNIENKLPDNVLLYRAVVSLISFGIMATFLYLFFGHGPVNGTVNGKPSTIDLQGTYKILVIYGIPSVLFILSLIYNIFYIKNFSFLLTDTSISITSGIFFIETRSIDFKDIQSISSSTGPILSLFGLSVLKGFTSSPGQIVISSNSKSGSSISYNPDILITLNKEDSEQLRTFISKADEVSKVKIVS